MINYGKKLRGRPKTSLPIVFKRDFALIQHSSKDLGDITELAHDKKRWRGLASQIEKAAEMSLTKNLDVARKELGVFQLGLHYAGWRK